MGCAGSSKSKHPSFEMSQGERAIKAAILIQKWYRRYRARQEFRRRCTWTIFQSLEYAGEQDQIKLSNFFNELITHVSRENASFKEFLDNSPHQSLKGKPIELDNLAEAETELLERTNPESIKVEEKYKGPTIKLPMTLQQVNKLIDTFKEKKLLHAKFVLMILHEARKLLQSKPNINQVSTALSTKVTVCGDIHGNLNDLLTVFYKNGLPESQNPYIFNGDFVDRGPQSTEVLILLLSCMLVWPDAVFLNRGNHEDFNVNLRYGFVKELMTKYTRHANMIIQVVEQLYSWLPVASLIDNRVFVVHGGISDKTDIGVLSSLDRHQFMTILKPPAASGSKLKTYIPQWHQLVDILWSDPRPVRGCFPNCIRGGGCFFGPDVTKHFLEQNRLDLLIRSHECKLDGYEYVHDNKVLTIFSASNYYDVGTNRGAYINLMGKDLKPNIVMYVGSTQTPKAEFRHRRGVLEESALRELLGLICGNQSLLRKEFKARDREKTGKISVQAWCAAMEKVLALDLPWRLLCPQIANYDPETKEVLYNTTFDQFALKHKVATENGPSLLETLYRKKDTLETIFRIMDKDGSGVISMDEFTDACKILSKHAQTPMSDKEIRELAQSIDINKDGQIDFNEFLEAFRLVSKDSKPQKSEKTGKRND